MFEYLKFWFMKQISELIIPFSILGIIALLFLLFLVFITIKDKINKRKDKK